MINETKLVNVTEENEYALAALALLKKAGIRDIRFPLYSGTLKGHDLSELDLTQRSFNCLKRSGVNSVGQLAAEVHSITDLMKMRNLGQKSAVEILLKLYVFQYMAIKPENRAAYLEEMAELTMERLAGAA